MVIQLLYIYIYGKCLGFAPNRNDYGQRIIIIITIIIINIIIPLLIFPIECKVATTFDWEWEPSTLQRWGKAQPRRCAYIYIARERERFPEKYPEIGCSTINHPLIEVFRATPFPNGSNIHVISPWHPHDLPHGSVLRGIQQFEGSFGQQNVLRHFAGLVS